MDPRISLVTLAVDDLERSLRFYRDALGLPTQGIVGREFEHGAVAFFDLQPGLRLALWPRASLANDTGLSIGRPDPTGFCLPVGPSRAFTAPFPFQLVQGSDTIGILFEYQSIWRAIYMDGRGHPDDVDEYPYFMGHSVGRWEGDVLVVDTAGIDERSWLDTAGHEHSAQLRLTERFEKTSPSTMQWTVTYDDPVYFTRPWSITRTFTRGKPGDRLLPYTCNENNKDVEHLQTHQPNLNYKHVPEARKPGGK